MRDEDRTGEQLIAEEKLSFLASIIESSDDAIVGETLDGTIISWNSGAQRIYGYSADEITGLPISILIPPDRNDELTKLIEKIRQEHHIKHYETVHIRKDGKQIDISLTISPIKDADGRIIGASTIARDITERRRSEEERDRLYREAQAAQEQVTTILESITDAFLAFDREWRIIRMNKKAEQLLHTKKNDLIGKVYWDMFPDIVDMIGYRELQRAVTENTTVEYEQFYPPRDAWFEARGYPSKDGVNVFIHDITERRQAEEALRKAHDELEMRVQERTADLEEANVELETEIQERLQAEEELRKSEVRYRELAESIGEVFFAMDRDLRYTYWNKASEQLTGILAKDALGKSLFELFPQLKETRAEKKYKEVLKTQQSQRFVNKYRVAGKTHFFEINAYPSKFGLTVIAKDITERKRAEEEVSFLQSMTQAINEAQDFHSALEVALRKVCETTGWNFAEAWIPRPRPDGTVLECSSAWYSSDMSLEKFRRLSENFTFSPGIGLPGRVWSSRQPEWIPDVSVIPDTIFPRAPIAREADLKASLAVPIIANDQVLAVVIFYMFEFREEDKRLVGIVSTIATQLGSVIQRKIAEEQIREQAALLDKAQDAITVRDLEHRIIYWNKSAQRLYGYTKEEAIGKKVDELLYKKESLILIEAKKRVIEEGEWIGELEQVTKNGKKIIVESRLTMVHDSEGRQKSILIVNTDITERKKIEAQFFRAQRMESIGTLASGIAHDLNNVLVPVMLTSQILREKFTDEQDQRLLNIIETNTQRGADLIKQVMSFARGVEGERMTLQVKHLIYEIKKIAKETFPRSIEIRTEAVKDLWTISGDATHLHQVLMNLCVNARDAMQDGGILSMSAENLFIDKNYARMNIDARVGNYIVITVSDTGDGISPGVMDRIFEPFFTTKEPDKGTGLGLSTVHAIVKGHGGFVNVYSEIGKGTTFKVYLPAIITTEELKVHVQRYEPPAGQGELVLVVDDEARICESTRRVLETHGYKAITANDGAEAVALYVQYREVIEVVLVDMMMPIMDGQACIRALRKINPGVRIIAISGLTGNGKLIRIAGTPVHAFLSKPYTTEKLLKTIYDVMSTK